MGSARVKAVRKTLMKLSPAVTKIRQLASRVVESDSEYYNKFVKYGKHVLNDLLKFELHVIFLSAKSAFAVKLLFRKKLMSN